MNKLIDEYNGIETEVTNWFEDNCQNFVTLQDSQFSMAKGRQQDEIKERLRNMGIRDI